MTYVPYMVAPSDSGVSKYLKPWLQPDQALSDMQDCYCYRGVIQKRTGFFLYDIFPNSAGFYNAGTGNGTTTVFTGNLPYIGAGVDIGKKSLKITWNHAGTYLTDGTDDGAGNITGTNITSGTINYTTGAYSITFNASPNAPAINTGIDIQYGIKIGVGNNTTTPGTLQIPVTGSFGLDIKRRSVLVGASTTPLQLSEQFDVPAPDGLTGNLANSTPGNVTAGTITYATGAITGLTFTSAVAPTDDIWVRWEWDDESEPIRGIKFYWTTSSNQDTLVFNNTQAAKFDTLNFKLTNISGPGYWTLTNAEQWFFNVANYLGKAWILNNKDPLTVWDGTVFARPTFTISTTGPITLVTGLLIFVYKNRLVVLRPTQSDGIKPQRALFSQTNNPYNFLTDVRGAGGFVDAPTPEWIVSAEFLRDELIVFFQDSTWKLRYTAVDTAPFRWEKMNDSRRVDCPYAIQSYQQFVTAMGSTGLLQCDGVAPNRYDEKIIDFTNEEVNLDIIGICNTQRYDPLNQQYLCYPSKDTPLSDFSNKWLTWNFVEGTFTEYNINSTCFGFFVQGRDLAWQDFTARNELDFAWEDFSDQNWLSYYSQGNAKIPVFGTKNGHVNQWGGFATDDGTRTGFEFLTKDFNPFIKEGMQARLGYIDFYFDNPNPEADADSTYEVSIDFFVNEEEIPYKTVVLNPSLDNWIKKRVFIGSIANFHRFRVYLSDTQIAASSAALLGFKLNGYILYFQKAGRIIG